MVQKSYNTSIHPKGIPKAYERHHSNSLELNTGSTDVQHVTSPIPVGHGRKSRHEYVDNVTKVQNDTTLGFSRELVQAGSPATTQLLKAAK